LNFYIVDVFAERRYTGNQLAVFKNAGAIPNSEMQQIAKEMNFSETTFILSDEERDGGYDVRIFTPQTELPFAGHPTLGTAYVIQREILKDPVEAIFLNLKIGRIPVTFSYRERKVDTLWMKQLQPTFGPTFDTDLVSQVLNLEPRQIDDEFPVQDVSSGVPCIIVPLKSLNAVKQARISRVKYYDFIRDTQAKTLLIFCPETYNKENDLNVRFFADYYGVPEDPATGSANGCLAGYLVKHRYFGTDRINIRVEQGYEIGRPSLLLLRAEEIAGKINVLVGGRVEMIAKGKFV
jgi:trans-2,3-dihydro-3-hydroxyanthranilate isomerase